jgi:type III restriction enzyme
MRLQSRHQLFPQVFSFVQKYVATRVNFNGVDPRELGLEKYTTLIVERIREAIQPETVDDDPPVLPILNRYRPSGRSGSVDFLTTYPVVQTKKSHVNLVVLHSQWEGEAARTLDESEVVKYYVRNDHLGLVIPYEYLGAQRSYEPDFLVRLVNDLQVLLEIKGFEVHDAEMVSAKNTAARKWVTAVNNLGHFGHWEFLVCRDLDQLGPELESLSKRALPRSQDSQLTIT